MLNKVPTKKPLTIVFSGHGAWVPAQDGFTTAPRNATCQFFTENSRTLSDSLGGRLDVANIQNLTPDQTVRPGAASPNMRLFPPTGLNIIAPTAQGWHRVDLPGGAIPAGADGIQVQISNSAPNGLSLAQLLQALDPAIRAASDVTILWSACRALDMNQSGNDIGLNTMQR